MQQEVHEDGQQHTGKGRDRSSVDVRHLPTHTLSSAQCATLELLLTGALGLSRYPGRRDREAAAARARLEDGTVCPLPPRLELPADLAATLSTGDRVVLEDHEGVPLGVLHVDERFREEVGEGRGAWSVAGDVSALQEPTHADFAALRTTPVETRGRLGGGRTAVAHFPTDVLHRPRIEALTAGVDGAPVLLLAGVAEARPTDLAHHVRIRCLRAAVAALPEPGGVLVLVPLPADGGGWRHLVRRAVVAAAHGAAAMLVDAADLARARVEATADAVDLDGLLADVGMTARALPQMAYAPGADRYVAVGGASPAQVHIAGDAVVGDLVAAGEPVPRSLALPEVVVELRRLRPPPAERGLTVFFTGLSGSGKSTIANLLAVRLLELGRRVTLLDGDLVRRHLSAGLGFSREDRDRNVRRIGLVAAEITRHGGTVVCAPIAPYDETRKAVRAAVEEGGRFVLVHVATPLEVCERRDRKGLYAKARAGLLTEFTGISDPYEVPDDADVVVDTRECSALEGAEDIVALLAREGLIATDATGARTPAGVDESRARRW